jgi:tetratricopeptide (TPR) repeat protein
VNRPSTATQRDSVADLRLVDEFQRAYRRRDRAEIAGCLEQMVARRVPMGEQWGQLSMIAFDLGEVTCARQAIDLLVESFGGTPASRFAKVGFLAHIGAFDEALALLRTLPADQPDPFSYALCRGASALSAGESEEARHWLGQAVRLRPQSGSAWHSISQLVGFAQEPELAEQLLAAEREMREASAIERSLYHYALGKAHADLGEHGRAFAAIAEAAAETKALYPFDRALARRRADEALEGYDAAALAALGRDASEPTSRAIFVMGLPRSGTTLVEQVLASHSQVAGGGEINLLRLLEHEVGGLSRPALDGYLRRPGAPSLPVLWDHLLEERFPGPGRVVDKTTNNSLRLGIAASVLPEAPLVWLRRDPLDCAWSCLRTRFMGGVAWSNDLEDIAFNFRLEDRLFEHWHSVLGERLLVVPFAALVTEPEPWIRRILAHCGLPEEPQAFAPHENRRVVTTASAMQVRRPINRAGVGAAEPYREFLAPFIDAYYG